MGLSVEHEVTIEGTYDVDGVKNLISELNLFVQRAESDKGGAQQESTYEEDERSLLEILFGGGGNDGLFCDQYQSGGEPPKRVRMRTRLTKQGVASGDDDDE